MARPRTAAARKPSPGGPGRGLLVGLTLLGLGFVGFGLWRSSRAPADAPPAEATDGSVAPTLGGADPAAAGASGPPMGGVAPGVVHIDEPAPTEQSAPRAGAVCPGCDVVLITVCSLRRDHVSAYGEHPGLTPAIDSIEAGGYRFDNAYAASNFTLASLTAILTGRYGSSTGVLGWDKGLVSDVPTLPEVLGYYGYRTGAFTVDAPSGFRPDYGLHRGFQRMEVIPSPRSTPDGRFRGGAPGPAGESAIPVSEWIAAQPTNRPIFAMFHSRSAHFPFVIDDDPAGTDPSGIHQLLWEAGMVDARQRGQAMPGMAGGTAQQGVVQITQDPLQVAVQAAGAPAVESWRARYAEAVHRMDADVAAVLDALRARGTLDRTVILLVADHGESLYDHEELLHGDAYWDSVINVPLLMRVPGLPGDPDGIGSLVSHTDVLPTLLELVGALPPAGIDGASMLPLLRGEVERIRDIALSEGGVARDWGGGPKGAVIALPWTLLRQQRGCGTGQDGPRQAGGPATCLYDLRQDPLQEHNVAREHPTVVTDLLGRWEAFRAARGTEGRSLALDPAFIEELHKNGYNFEASPR